MKTLFFIIVILLMSMFTQAQDYYINFKTSKHSDTSAINTIKVFNLTTLDSVTLNGGDVLHLHYWPIDGINNLNNINLSIYPNPTYNKSTLKFTATESGDVVIGVYDITGKVIYKNTEYLSEGIHTFNISGVGNGMFLVRITGENYDYSTKLVGSSENIENINIQHVSFTPSVKHLKESKIVEDSTVEMTYSTGQHLQYTAISDTFWTKMTSKPRRICDKVVKMDVPTKSETDTFYFYKCLDTINIHNYRTIQIQHPITGDNPSNDSISTEIWMDENLNVGTQIPSLVAGTMGDSLPNLQKNNGILEKYCYNNDTNKCTIYGGLYQWDEAMQYDTTYDTIHHQGICPSGWHIPTKTEFESLVIFLGGHFDINPILEVDSLTGGKMKEVGFNHWNSPNPATNETGFTALGGGFFEFDALNNYYYYRDIKNYTRFWSSSQWSNYNLPTDMFLYSDNTNVVIGSGETKQNAYSVRCIHN